MLHHLKSGVVAIADHVRIGPLAEITHGLGQLFAMILPQPDRESDGQMSGL